MQGIVGLGVRCDFCFVDADVVFCHNPAVIGCFLGLLFAPEGGGMSQDSVGDPVPNCTVVAIHGN
jgi:hypothetical protein